MHLNRGQEVELQQGSVITHHVEHHHMLLVKPLGMAGDGTSGNGVQQEDCRKLSVTVSACTPRAETKMPWHR